MDLLEQVSGNRVNYSANVLGGVKFDITAAQIDHILEGMELLEERTQHYLEVATQDESFLLRTRGIGRMSKAQSELQGTVGPTARASDVARDVRVDSPYAAYRSFPVNLITETEGDLLARFIVRIRELFESIRLIREIVTHLPEGELSTRVPSKIPEGEATIYSEAPRGELFYFIKSAGGKTPYRVKVRTPTLTNWGAVLPTVTGAQLADVPMILVGIDPCFSCNDRVITINRGTEGGDPWTWEKLRRYGIEYYR
jgi:NADH-quinone oxidoreductase subunit D